MRWQARIPALQANISVWGTDRALALHGVVPQMRTDDVPGWPQRRTDDVVTAGTDLPGLKGTGWLESDARTP